MRVLGFYLDKMTIVANLKNELETSFQKVLDDVVDVKILKAATSLVSGVFFNNSENSIYFEFDGISAKAMNKRNFRMEFNPSKITSEQSLFIKSRIMPLLNDVAFSRLDLALDVDVDLSEYFFEVWGRVKTDIYSKDNKLSTKYIGSRQSERMIRVYDKKRQLSEVENLQVSHEKMWRLEFELKGSNYIEKLCNDGFYSVFDFRVIQYDFSNLTALEKILVKSMYTESNLFADLNSATKAKYRKLAKQCDGVDVSSVMLETIKKNNSLILAELESYKSNSIKSFN